MKRIISVFFKYALGLFLVYFLLITICEFYKIEHGLPSIYELAEFFKLKTIGFIFIALFVLRLLPSIIKNQIKDTYKRL